jgi:hypothetical protein
MYGSDAEKTIDSAEVLARSLFANKKFEETVALF